MIQKIRAELLEMQDLKYKEFHCKLMPTVDEDSVIGVRVPMLRKYVKELLKEAKQDEEISVGIEEFLNDLPHKYYEENNVHAFIIESGKDYNQCIDRLDRFLPYVNNWATCDIMKPKIFKKHLKELELQIIKWLDSNDVYTVRFAIGMLMGFYLDDVFEEKYLEYVAEKESEEYYVNMMRAWYFATALAKQWDATFPFIEEKKLDVWTHNKTIQKAVESNRITKDQKELLKNFKVYK